MTTRWLCGVTRPVLGWLMATIVWRHVDQLLGIALLVLPLAWLASASGVHPWPGLTPGAMTAVVVGLAAGKAAARYLEQFTGHRVAFRALELLRQELYRALSMRATMVRRAEGSGDVLVRATRDVDRIEVFFAHTVPPLVTAVTVPVICTVAVALRVGWVAAAVLAVGAVVAGVLVPAIGRRTARAVAKRAGEHRGRLAQHLTDSVQGAPELLGYGRVDDRLRETDEVMTQQPATSAVDAWRGAARTMVAPLVLLAVTLATRVHADPVTTAVVAALSWRAVMAVDPVAAFTDTLPTTMAAARRVHRLAIATPHPPVPTRPVPLPEGPLAVCWDQVTYRHPGSRRDPALEEVDVTVTAGSHVCLIGTSGSGKSTMLELAARFDDPTSGRMLIAGVDLRSVDPVELHRRVQFLPQQEVLFDLSVAENLRLGCPDASLERLWAALSTAGLADVVAALPQGLDTPLGEHGSRLSGGERQRLCLARALVHCPDLLLADEFTSHLDPALAHTVRSRLRRDHPRMTIVETTHTLAGITTADQVVVVEAGRLRPDLLETWETRAEQ